VNQSSGDKLTLLLVPEFLDCGLQNSRLAESLRLSDHLRRGRPWNLQFSAI
jgi:hypothetical protein